jgi:hypothetical protein
MYVWLWRHLPGRGWVRACQALALVVAAAVGCCAWAFPLIDRYVGGDPNVVPNVQTPAPARTGSTPGSHG